MLKNRWRLADNFKSLKFTIFRRGMNEKTDLPFWEKRVVSPEKDISLGLVFIVCDVPDVGLSLPSMHRIDLHPKS